jgi:DNA-binding MarR family transcriptional regulator
METPLNPKPIYQRIREGLARLASALRTEDWERAQNLGLNPTQLAILDGLAGRSTGLGVKQIAFELGVSQPTATDSIKALEAKGYVGRRPDPADGRVVRIVLTGKGKAIRSRPDGTIGVGDVIATLPTVEQERMLVALVGIIRGLQEADAIPVQRMCVSCIHFRPFVHPTGPTPHHCNFVDAAFGQADLRIECREHEAADPSLRAATWNEFKDPTTLQAK